MLCISFDLLKRVGEAFFCYFLFRQALVIMNFLCLAITVRERGDVSVTCLCMNRLSNYANIIVLVCTSQRKPALAKR